MLELGKLAPPLPPNTPAHFALHPPPPYSGSDSTILPSWQSRKNILFGTRLVATGLRLVRRVTGQLGTFRFSIPMGGPEEGDPTSQEEAQCVVSRQLWL